MEKEKLFLDPLHVKKNMSCAIGAERPTGIVVYDRAVHVPSRGIMDVIKQKYGPKTRAYLGKLADEELYSSCSLLQDFVTSSKGTESEMYASIRNGIRGVEPQSMLKNVVETQCCKFLKRKARALNWTEHVAPHVEKHLAYLI